MLSNQCACLQTNAKKHLTAESQLRRQRVLTTALRRERKHRGSLGAAYQDKKAGLAT